MQNVNGVCVSTMQMKGVGWNAAMKTEKQDKKQMNAR